MNNSLGENGEGSALPPVSAENLRQHFKKTYKLHDEQVDLMLESSARSLRNTFTAADTTLLTSKRYEEVARHAHSMKGLLLNMGEKEWAERARKIEIAALAEEDVDYVTMVNEIRRGVGEIL